MPATGTSYGSPDDMSPFLGQVNSENKLSMEVAKMSLVILSIIIFIIVAPLLNEIVTVSLSFVVNFEFALKMIFPLFDGEILYFKQFLNKL